MNIIIADTHSYSKELIKSCNEDMDNINANILNNANSIIPDFEKLVKTVNNIKFGTNDTGINADIKTALEDIKKYKEATENEITFLNDMKNQNIENHNKQTSSHTWHCAKRKISKTLYNKITQQYYKKEYTEHGFGNISDNGTCTVEEWEEILEIINT